MASRALHYGPLHPETMLSPPRRAAGHRHGPAGSDIGRRHPCRHRPGRPWTATAFQDGRTLGVERRARQTHARPLRLGRQGSPPSRNRRRRPFAAMWESRRRSTRRPHGDCTTAQEASAGARRTAAPRQSTRSRRAPPSSTCSPSIRAISACPRGRDIGDPQVLEGKRLFYDANCIGCHTPKFVTTSGLHRRGAVLPAHLALLRPPASRHGGRARRRPARGRGQRP